MAKDDPYSFLPNNIPTGPGVEMDLETAERLKRSMPKKPIAAPENQEQFEKFISSTNQPIKPITFGPEGITGLNLSPTLESPSEKAKKEEENEDEPQDTPTVPNYSDIKGRIEPNSSLPFLQPPTVNPNNPLKAYFRSPEMFVRLPSRGLFNKNGDFSFTADGAIGIYPMTAKDELALRTPDALLNGAALKQIISSCTPDIHDIDNLPSPDFDVILLGIRSVSYGPKLEYESNCPKCQTKSDWAIDIPSVLESVKPLEGPAQLVLKSGVKLSIKPYTFSSNIKAALVGYEEAQLIRAVTQQDIPEEEKMLQFNDAVGRIAILNKQLFAASIIRVDTPDGQTVSDKQFILEYLDNLSKNDFDQIEEKIKILNAAGFQRNVTVTCSNKKCNHEYQTDITYDPTRFFVKGS